MERDFNTDPIRVGITQGDINGISYEVILKVLNDSRICEFCTPVVYGSPKVAAYHRKTFTAINLVFNNAKDIYDIVPKRPNIINCVDENIRVELGKSTPTAGEASLNALQMAVEDMKKGALDVLVTAPINKHNIQSPDFSFAGHTEYLVQQFGSRIQKGMMFMVSERLKVGVVTGHIPVKDVPSHISEQKILEKLRLMNRSLLQDFGIRSPKIAVLGLNPHAGDGGVIGMEEEEIIIPAIEKARTEGITALGPYPADGFFGTLNFLKFDGVLAMYHDQGLIPFKMYSFEDGINFTAGLPIVRTSPAHGTAYELAGLDKAAPDSFRNALYFACDIFKNRLNYKEITANPLQKQELLESGTEIQNIIGL